MVVSAGMSAGLKNRVVGATAAVGLNVDTEFVSRGDVDVDTGFIEMTVSDGLNEMVVIESEAVGMVSIGSVARALEMVSVVALAVALCVAKAELVSVLLLYKKVYEAGIGMV